jgi:uncharacterized protein DUF4920
MKKMILFLAVMAVAGAAERKLGKPLTLKQPTPIPTLISEPAPYLGKVVQVKGKITEVCQEMGCWMAIADPESGKTVRVKVNDGEIVFPKDAAGKTAVAEGKFSRIELNREQAVAYLQHQAEENGRKFDPAGVKSGLTIYQLAGLGAVITD